MNYNYKEVMNITSDLHILKLIETITNILDRIEDPGDEEDIYQSIDDELIYTFDQWKILEEYCTPQEANWDQAIEKFTDDIYTIINAII